MTFFAQGFHHSPFWGCPKNSVIAKTTKLLTAMPVSSFICDKHSKSSGFTWMFNILVSFIRYPSINDFNLFISASNPNIVKAFLTEAFAEYSNSLTPYSKLLGNLLNDKTTANSIRRSTIGSFIAPSSISFCMPFAKSSITLYVESLIGHSPLFQLIVRFHLTLFRNLLLGHGHLFPNSPNVLYKHGLIQNIRFYHYQNNVQLYHTNQVLKYNQEMNFYRNYLSFRLLSLLSSKFLLYFDFQFDKLFFLLHYPCERLGQKSDDPTKCHSHFLKLSLHALLGILKSPRILSTNFLVCSDLDHFVFHLQKKLLYRGGGQQDLFDNIRLQHANNFDTFLEKLFLVHSSNHSPLCQNVLYFQNMLLQLKCLVPAFLIPLLKGKSSSRTKCLSPKDVYIVPQTLSSCVLSFIHSSIYGDFQDALQSEELSFLLHHPHIQGGHLHDDPTISRNCSLIPFHHALLNRKGDNRLLETILDRYENFVHHLLDQSLLVHCNFRYLHTRNQPLAHLLNAQLALFDTVPFDNSKSVYIFPVSSFLDCRGLRNMLFLDTCLVLLCLKYPPAKRDTVGYCADAETMFTRVINESINRHLSFCVVGTSSVKKNNISSISLPLCSLAKSKSLFMINSKMSPCTACSGVIAVISLLLLVDCYCAVLSAKLTFVVAVMLFKTAKDIFISDRVILVSSALISLDKASSSLLLRSWFISLLLLVDCHTLLFRNRLCIPTGLSYRWESPVSQHQVILSLCLINSPSLLLLRTSDLLQSLGRVHLCNLLSLLFSLYVLLLVSWFSLMLVTLKSQNDLLELECRRRRFSQSETYSSMLLEFELVAIHLNLCRLCMLLSILASLLLSSYVLLCGKDMIAIYKSITFKTIPNINLISHEEGIYGNNRA